MTTIEVVKMIAAINLAALREDELGRLLGQISRLLREALDDMVLVCVGGKAVLALPMERAGQEEESDVMSD